MPCVGCIVLLEAELTCQANCLSDASFQNKVWLQQSWRPRDVVLEGPAPQQLPAETGYPAGLGNSTACLNIREQLARR